MKNNWENNEEYKSFLIKLIIILVFSLCLLFFYKILNIIFILFISSFLTLLFSPLLNKFNEWKINDFFWIIIIFLIFLVILTLVFFSIIPLILNQNIEIFSETSKFANNLIDIYKNKWVEWFWFPKIIENILINLNIEQILNLINENTAQFSTFLKDIVSNWVEVISWFTSAIFNLIMIVVFTFFITLERKIIRNFFYTILPINISKYFYDNEKELISTLSKWLKWQFILSWIVFFLTLLGLFILKLFWIEINWIFALALIAWFMEFIPYIWIFISFFVAVIMSFWAWIEWLIAISILYIIIQQIEWTVLYPFVMWKAIKVTPFSVLLIMIIWWSLFWIIWIFLAIPFLLTINIFLKPYINKKIKKISFLNSKK